MKTPYVLIVVAGSFIVGALMERMNAPAKPAPIVGNAEVSDLIARLDPLTKEPGSTYWGVTVTFSGGGVKIAMRLKNNDEYSASARTLAGAVERLTGPATEIQTALQGWKAP